MTHTQPSPTPWHLHGEDIIDADGLLVAELLSENPLDGRLLNAAPEMLEALRITQRTVDGDFAAGYVIRVTGHEMEAIRAAIAKAEGR